MKVETATTLAVSAAYLLYAVLTPYHVDLYGYLGPVFLAYFMSMRFYSSKMEKHFVLVGYVLWISAYFLQIYVGYQSKLSTWPLFCAAYYIVNEILVCSTTLFETKDKTYSTPKYVRIGYWIYFACDAVLNMQILYYGTGSAYDELGLLPVRTVPERITALSLYAFCWLITLVVLAKVAPRQAKYFMYGFHFICHASSLRLPLTKLDPRMFAIAKAQVYGSAFYAVRYRSVSLPEPKYWYRFLMFAMPIFCSLLSGSVKVSNYVLQMSYTEFRSAVLGWILLSWSVILVFMDNRSSINADELKAA